MRRPIPTFEADISHVELSEQLGPLRAFLPNGDHRYRAAEWLRSSFDSPIWKVCSQNSFEIDWRVRLGSSAELLTHPRHSRLLETFRSWLIVQTHPDYTGRCLTSAGASYNNIRCAISLIDFLLLRADAFKLREYGVGFISEGDWRQIVASIASSKSNSISVYEWPSRLEVLVRSAIKQLRRADRRRALREAPFLAKDLPDATYRLTTLSDEEVLDARVWLWTSRYYWSRPNVSSHKWEVDCRVLAEKLYADTIAGRSTVLQRPVEFSLLPGYRLLREFPGVPVTAGAEGEGRSARGLERYVRAIRSLQLLKTEGLDVPHFDEQSIASLTGHLDLPSPGRFRTLPYEVVMEALRHALTYALSCGDALVDAYLELAREAKRSGCAVAVLGASLAESGSLRVKAGAMDVRLWSVEQIGLEAGTTKANDYYRYLRSSPGLYESIRVLFGAIQVAVGTLMARRYGELRDLAGNGCLDPTETRLVFKNRKSGIGDLRNTEARPIPPVGVRLVKMLMRLQEGMVELGLIDKAGLLFAFPRAQHGDGLVVLTSDAYRSSLDYFCDFFELQLDEEGRRYYIRQHQLRRWFAMVFFWGNSFGGLETLRWFLGHTDMEHLYHYITESTPGSVLRGVEADWAVEAVRRLAPEASQLADLVAVHFGTRNFRALEEEKLSLYIEQLMADGTVEIEPEFLDAGRTCRICVRIHESVPEIA
jgi:hypothetical protein